MTEIHTMLAARSCFSLGESTLTIDKLVAEARRTGASAVGMTDTMTISGLIDLHQACKAAGIKPVVGCRLRIVDDLTWRKSRGGPKAPPEYYLTWYILREPGLTALYRLLSLANSADRFYERAKLTVDDVCDALRGVSADDVAIVLGDVYSIGAHPDAVGIAQRLNDALGAKIHAQITPVHTPYFDTLNKHQIALAQALGLPLIAARPALYGAGEDALQEVYQAVLRNAKITDPWHWSMHSRNLAPLSRRDFVEEVKAAAERLKGRGVSNVGAVVKQALEGAAALVERVSYVWAKQQPSLPAMAENEHAAVVEACKEGWKQRFVRDVFGHRPSMDDLRNIYAPRLKYELEVLQKLNFSGYFLLVQDIVRWAKSQGIFVGPGRGSVGGSLVAYLMGITECDPIRFNLMFERFINPERADLPDADLDFMTSRRHEVIAYLTAKYGTDRVAGISNYTELGGASAMRDVSKACGLDERDYSCSKLMPKKHGQPVGLEEAAEEVPEIAVFKENNPGVWQIAVGLEGTMRSLGRHAAGMVIAGCDLVSRAVVEQRSGEPTVNWDMRACEPQGLVKVDILGLETLDVQKLALAYILERHGKRPDLLALALDDPKVLENFSKGLTTGVFQFESAGMKRLLRDLGQDGTLTFEDITAGTALYRPGPMDSGMLESYVRRKQGREIVAYEHPDMAQALETTYGVMVYQEQVMRISQILAGFSGAEADKLRKAMGKKLPEEMEKYRAKFVDGCETIGLIDRETAAELFDKIEKFAGYGFNRSHSVEYSLISYQSMWLKTYYPVEFFAACLSLMKEEKLAGILADAATFGIEILPPDVNLSSDRFEILTDTKLLIPFNRIKGVSEATCIAIAEARKAGPFKDAADFESRVEKRRCNIRHKDLLRRVGAFASIEPGSLPARHPDRIKDQVELMPGLVSDSVPVNRRMLTDDPAKRALIALVQQYREADPALVKPCLGKSARFMVVMDAPTIGEEKAGQMTMHESFQSVSAALRAVGMDRQSAYWTSLVKRPKSGKQLTAEELTAFGPLLDREIEILKPPLILLLGSASARYFFKDMKGAITEHIGKVRYCPALDANLVIGFAPGMIFHDPSKQDLMDEVMAKVSSIMELS